MEFATLNQLLSRAVETYQKPDALSYKKDGTWHRISSEEWLARARNVALGLHELGVRARDRVALLSENRPEWFLLDAGMQILGAVNVPLYSTLMPEQIAYIINDSGANVVIASTADQQKKIAAVKNGLSAVKHFVAIEPGAELDAIALASVEDSGKAAGDKDSSLAQTLADAVKPDDLASIVYTSGTTGDPKGVMLTQDNLVSNVRASLEVLPIGRDDVALSALPYSHVFERMVAHYLYPAAGTSIAVAGSLEEVPQNLGEVRPTVMTMVPRFYEKLYARVKESVDQGSATKRKIFHWAIGIGREHGEYRLKGEPAPTTLELKYKLATALVFGKLQKRIGGRLRFFVSGAAPLPKTIADFFWAAGITIVEGYGLTETSPVISVNRPGAIKFGSVGRVIPGVEVKIADDGEICVRGPNVMKGYYNNEGATREVIDSDGFFHTGDIGELDADGYLRITDRKKDIIVTAGGKNIAPQAIEGKLKTNAYIAEVVVVGNARKFPSALVVPDYDKLVAWCRTQSIPTDERDELATHPKVTEFLLAQIEDLSIGFAPYERIKKIAVLAKEFSIEKGELTPTMKVKRNVIESRYKHLIDELYREPATV
jgi:long-chain acyl-CoA synthetase